MVKFLKRGYIAILLGFLYLPIFTLIVFAFNSGKTMARWGGFSLQWFEALFRDKIIMESLANSISLAVTSTLIAVVVGTIAAIGINEYKKVKKTVIINLTYVPIMNADIVTGISMLLVFIFMRFDRGYGTVLISHIMFNIPFVIFAVLPKLRTLDPHLYEAAIDMGAKPRQAIWKVIIPQLTPGIMTGAVIAFTMSFDDFVITYFSAQGQVNTLSTHIYSMAKIGINPKINALSALMFVFVITLLVIINIKSFRKQPVEGKSIDN